MSSIIWFLVFLFGALVLAYQRVACSPQRSRTAARCCCTRSPARSLATMIVLWVVLAVLVLLNIDAFRIRFISRPFLRTYRRMLPSMSQTEKDALEAGTVWWDGELFTGGPDWDKLLSATPPRLSAEEQAFIDGPCEELCRMIDDWDITHRRADLPPHLWDYIKSKGFFAMIIPKKYGGLEFSAYAHSCVLVKLSSRSGVVASTVAVPNSLGPAELLLHYGTEEQRNHYLPRLARGDEVPCFALTGPRAGSDAASIPDTGIVCKGHVRRSRDRRRAAELLEALHHARAGRDRRRPGVQAVRSRAAARRRPHRLRHHLRADSASHARRHDRPAALPAERAVPERADPGQGRVRAARLPDRRAEDGRPGLAHARRAAVGRTLHLAAVERDRRGEGGRVRDAARTRASAGSSTCRSASSKASRKRSRA